MQVGLHHCPFKRCPSVIPVAPDRLCAIEGDGGMWKGRRGPLFVGHLLSKHHGYDWTEYIDLRGIGYEGLLQFLTQKRRLQSSDSNCRIIHTKWPKLLKRPSPIYPQGYRLPDTPPVVSSPPDGDRRSFICLVAPTPSGTEAQHACEIYAPPEVASEAPADYQGFIHENRNSSKFTNVDSRWGTAASGFPSLFDFKESFYNGPVVEAQPGLFEGRLMRVMRPSGSLVLPIPASTLRRQFDDLARHVVVIDRSQIHRHGLSSRRNFDKGELVLDYRGVHLSLKDALVVEEEHRKYLGEQTYMFQVEEDVYIDATTRPTVARFINHCCAPNCIALRMPGSTKERNTYVGIFAKCAIRAGEEFTIDYYLPECREECNCGKDNCRKFL